MWQSNLCEQDNFQKKRGFLALFKLIFWSVSADFLTNFPKIFKNCAFTEDLLTGKLGEISVFYAVQYRNCNSKLCETLAKESHFKSRCRPLTWIFTSNTALSHVASRNQLPGFFINRSYAPNRLKL